MRTGGSRQSCEEGYLCGSSPLVLILYPYPHISLTKAPADMVVMAIPPS